MSRSIFGVNVSALVGWCLRNPERFASPMRTIPARWNAFGARARGVAISRGDLLALTVPASWHPRETHAGALALRDLCDTTVPTHREPYAALAGRVVAVATLAACTSLTERTPAPWRRPALRAALGCEDRPGAREWWWELGAAVHVLPEPVECAGDVGLWSLPHHVSCAVMDQARAIEARAARDAARAGR